MRILRSSNSVQHVAERQVRDVAALQARGITPRLDVVRTPLPKTPSERQQEQDREIRAYGYALRQHAESIGARLVTHLVEPARIIPLVEELNRARGTHGIMLFSPPFGLSGEAAEAAFNAVIRRKNVDGLGAGKQLFVPATALAVSALMKVNAIDPAQPGTLVTRIGNGRTVGQPLGAIHRAQGVNETVITASNTDQEREAAIQAADIVIAAAGVPGLVTDKSLRDGQTIIGVGRRDVDESVHEAGWAGLDIAITYDEGVGPLTAAFVLEHTLQSARGEVVGGFATLDCVDFGMELVLAQQVEPRALVAA